MKQIENGYAAFYYMAEDGTLYNAAADKVITPDRRHMYRLKTEDGSMKRTTQRALYKRVYGKRLCRDSIESI